jgi:hypothetical protein
MLYVISINRRICFLGVGATFCEFLRVCALLYSQIFQTFNMCTTSLQRNGAMHPY